MKKRIKILLILGLCLTTVFSTKVFADSDLYVSDWKIYAEVKRDASLEVLEDISFNFDSDFNGVFKEIYLKNSQGISDLSIEEVGNPKAYKKLDNPKNGDSNVYSLEESEDLLKIKIYCPSKEGQKTFRFKYRLEGVVSKYNDIADFNHEFIGSSNNTYVESLSVNIKTPDFKKEDLEIFSHGTENTIIHYNNQSVSLVADYISENTSIIGRILMPTSYIDSSPKTFKSNGLDKIMEEEASYLKIEKDAKLKQEKRKKSFSDFSLIAIVLGAIASLLAFLRSKLSSPRRKGKASSNPIYFPPGIVAGLSRMAFDNNVIIASIYDLTSRGYLKLEKDGDYLKKHSKDKIDNFKISRTDKLETDLLKHEKVLLDWLFKDMVNKSSITTEEIYEYTRKKSMDFSKHFNKFYNAIREDLVDLKLKDNSSRGLGIFLAIISFVFLPLSVINLIAYRNIIKGIVSLALFILLLIMGIELSQKLTPLGQDQYDSLMLLKKKILKENLAIKDEKILITSMALGIDSRYIKDNSRYFETEAGFDSSWLYYFFLFNTSGRNVFAESFSSASSISDVNTSSFTGPSGGASGGGGVGGF